MHSKDMYTDDLDDIRIKNTVEEVSKQEVKKEKQKKSEDLEPIRFDDLPDIGKENSNPFKKLTNWAKQLF
jgi:hypothetical protein